MALTADRRVSTVGPVDYQSLPVKSGVTIYAGAFVCCDATGYAVLAADNAAYTAVAGVATSTADNSAGADGAIDVQIGRGTYMIRENDPANPVSGSLRNRTVYALDDELPSSSIGVARPELGVLRESWFDGYEITIGSL